MQNATDKHREGDARGEPVEVASEPELAEAPQQRPREIGGPSGPEPTRYGDWERKGRCIDF